MQLDPLSSSFNTLSLVSAGEKSGRPRSISEAKESPRDIVHIQTYSFSRFQTQDAFRNAIAKIRVSEGKKTGNAIFCHSVNNYGITLEEPPELDQTQLPIACVINGRRVQIVSKDAYYDEKTRKIFACKQASINADEVIAAKIANYECFVLADGCNWGERAQLAAQTAVGTAFTHMQGTLPKISKNTRSIAGMLLDSVAKAQDALTEATEAKASSTTFLAGCAQGDQFVAVSVGDCKVFLLRKFTESETNKTTLSCIDIFPATRTDSTDPGGRLSSTGPDWRNLAVAIVTLLPGDIIVACSDGVSDNITSREFAEIAGDEPSKIISRIFSYCASNCLDANRYLLENTGRLQALEGVKPDHASLVVFKYDPKPLKKLHGSHLGDNK